MNTNTNISNAGALCERAMLVSLRVSCWLPPVVDKAITQSIADAHKVSTRRVRATKYLIDPDTPSFRAVRRGLGDLRTRYYWHTLPWAHHGARILPAVSFAQYSDDMRVLSRRATDAIDVFVAEWPRLTTLAIAETHGLVTADDFPADIRDRFGIETQVMPIPTVPDFRIQMTDEHAASLRAQMQAGVDAQVREALALAAREPYQRLHKHVNRMIERLSDANGTFRDSLVDGLRELTAAMPALNLTGDAELTRICQACDAMVAGIDAQRLRDEPAVREATVQQAAALRDAIAPHLATDATPTPASDEVTRQAAGIEATMGGFFAFNGGK